MKLNTSMTAIGGVPLAVIAGIVLSGGLTATPTVARATTCGVDDCSSNLGWTFVCCNYIGFRCRIFKRRVCSASPPGFEYEEISNTVGDCSTSDAWPIQEISHVSCVQPPE